MKDWTCRLTPESLEILRNRTGLQDIANEVDLKTEFDTPVSHVQDEALDAIIVLIDQERHGLTPNELWQLRQELKVQCDVVAPR